MVSHSRAFTVSSFHFRLAAVWFYWCYDVIVFCRYCHSFPSIARPNSWWTDEDEDPTSSTKSFVEFDQVATLWLVFFFIEIKLTSVQQFRRALFTLQAPYTFWKVSLLRESYSFLSFFYNPTAIKKESLTIGKVELITENWYERL